MKLLISGLHNCDFLKKVLCMTIKQKTTLESYCVGYCRVAIKFLVLSQLQNFIIKIEATYNIA